MEDHTHDIGMHSGIIRNIHRIALIVVLIIYPYSISKAADLTLICNVTRSEESGEQMMIQLRYEIVWAFGHVSPFINYGTGFSPSSNYKMVGADSTRITLHNSDGEQSYIDRTTGEFYYNWEGSKAIPAFIERGTCVNIQTGAARF